MKSTISRRVALRGIASSAAGLGPYRIGRFACPCGEAGRELAKIDPSRVGMGRSHPIQVGAMDGRPTIRPP